MGLPLHLWGDELFKSIGDKCGGFSKVDCDTQEGEELRWARILVKGNQSLPEAVTVKVGGWVFRLHIWVKDMGSCYFDDGGIGSEVRYGGTVDVRAGKKASKLQVGAPILVGICSGFGGRKPQRKVRVYRPCSGAAGVSPARQQPGDFFHWERDAILLRPTAASSSGFSGETFCKGVVSKVVDGLGE